ncbi:MAG: hypothetical protein WCF85_05375 [Rhodospirillaceae bacterium]
MQTSIIGLVSALFVVLMVAVGWDKPAPDLVALATPVKNLTQAVKAVVKFGHEADGLEGDDLLKFAARNDKTLLEPFAADTRLKLQVHRTKLKNSALLLCYNELAVYEDLSCTSAVDRNLVQSLTAPCGFALDIDKECAAALQ